MSEISKKFLVIGVLVSKKNSKMYASGRMWSPDRKMWIGSKSGETWGDQMIEIPEETYAKLKSQIEACKVVICDAVSVGFNDFNFPIWSLKL